MSVPDPEKKNRMYAAGLLWRLFSSPARKNIATHLSTETLKRLNVAFEHYINLSSEQKKNVGRIIQKETGISHGSTAMTAFVLSLLITGALFAGHMVLGPMMSIQLRISVFTPLVFGVISLLVIQMIPPYRLRQLFDPRPDEFPTLFFAGIGFLGLLWTIYSIQLETDLRFMYRPDGLTLAIILAGAATGPVLEELLFREIFPGMLGKPPHYVGHLISAILFAAGHLPDTPVMALLYFISALILSSVRWLTDGLFYPVVLHSMANVVIVLVFL